MQGKFRKRRLLYINVQPEIITLFTFYIVVVSPLDGRSWRPKHVVHVINNWMSEYQGIYCVVGNHRIRWLLGYYRTIVPKFVNKFCYSQGRILGRLIKIFILCRLCCCCCYKPSSRNLLFNLFTCLAWRLNCGLEMAALTFLHYEGILIGMVGRLTAAWL